MFTIEDYANIPASDLYLAVVGKVLNGSPRNAVEKDEQKIASEIADGLIQYGEEMFTKEMAEEIEYQISTMYGVSKVVHENVSIVARLGENYIDLLNDAKKIDTSKFYLRNLEPLLIHYGRDEFCFKEEDNGSVCMYLANLEALEEYEQRNL